MSVNDALAKHAHLIVLGDPGAGKTTLLKFITLAFAQKRSADIGLAEDRLPVFVRLYDYVAKRAARQTDYSLVDYLYTQAHETLCVNLEPGFFEAELDRGNCCVCLDGLDELGGAGLRHGVVADVTALVNRYARNRYLITSRLVGYEEAPLDKREFVHHTVLPFTDDDIRAFVTKWYIVREVDPAAARARSQHLIDTILREDGIKRLATNPLMLTIIALVHRIEAELPHERVKLYEKCVTALVQTWEEVKGLRTEDRQRPYYKYRRRLLEQLAYWMHTQAGERGRSREVKEGDLKLHIARFLSENPKLGLDDESARQEAQEFVALIKSRTGLLIERGAGIYTFAHLTFQEYLAAADIERRLVHSIDAIWAEIQPRLHDPHWREVILLLLGSLNKHDEHNTELVSRILNSTDQYEVILHRHLYLAARALADRIEVAVALRQRLIDQLIDVAQSGGYWLHDDALDALSQLHSEAYAAKRLIQWVTTDGLAANEWDDIIDALVNLNRPDDSVLQGLLSLAQSLSVESQVRQRAARALGQLGQTNEAARLLQALAQDTTVEAFVRLGAARSLGELGRTDEATQVLLEIAQDTTVGAFVRFDAAQSLDDSGRTDEATQVLLALVQDGTVEASVRCIAARSLGELDPLCHNV